MLIGLMSDTHGDVERTAAAVGIFRKARVQHILHAGDVGAQSVLDELAALDIPITAVRGNVDYDLGLPRFQALTLADRRIAIVHGDDYQRLESAIATHEFDYVITGHTHVRSDERDGKTRVINPGAVYRATVPSVAVLDLETDSLEYLPLPPSAK